MKLALSLVLILSTVSVLFSGPLAAAELTVDGKGGADFTDIQAALDASADGDTVIVKPGEYLIAEPLGFNRLHNPNDPDSPPVKNLVLRSESGAKKTIISGPMSFSHGEEDFSVVQGFQLRGLSCGNRSSPSILDCVIFQYSYNTASVQCSNASPLLKSCTIAQDSSHRCSAGGWCGGCCSYGAVWLSDGSSPVFVECRIHGAQAPAIVSYEATVALDRCVLSRKGAVPAGLTGVSTALYCVRSQTKLRRCTILSMDERRGVGIFGGESSFTVESCILWSFATSIMPEGGTTVIVSHSCIQGDTPWPGTGNINLDPRLCGRKAPRKAYVDASSVAPGDGSAERPFASLEEGFDFDFGLARSSPCLGTGEGGANMGAAGVTCEAPSEAVTERIHLAPGAYVTPLVGFPVGASIEGAGAEATTLTLLGPPPELRTGTRLSGLTIVRSDQTAMSPELFVGAGQTPKIEDCVLVDAVLDGFADSSVLFQRCGLTGVFVSQLPVRLENCLLESVTYLGTAHPFDLIHCTVVGSGDNSQSFLPGTASLQNCILWDNRWSGDLPCCGQADVGGNLLGDVDPLFVAPGGWDDNGTPEDPADDRWIPGDYHLLPESPAIDAGVSEGAPATDIEGTPRPCGNGVDSGAFEYCPPPPLKRFRRGEVNGDGKLDLSDAVVTLEFLFLGAAEPDCLDATDGNDSGSVDLSDAVYALGYLFLGTAPPPEPFPECGSDPTPDELGCGDFPSC